MPDIERTVTTTASPQVVWDYLSDFRNTEEWDPPTRSTTREQGDGSVGTVYRNISSILGNDVEIEYTVVERKAPHRIQLRGTTSAMEMLDTITVEPDGEGSKVTYHAEFSPQGAAKLTHPLLPLGLKKLGDDAAEQMEQCLAKL
jgi:carbon monoxide dehydrogenase subunit G